MVAFAAETRRRGGVRVSKNDFKKASGACCARDLAAAAAKSPDMSTCLADVELNNGAHVDAEDAADATVAEVNEVGADKDEADSDAVAEMGKFVFADNVGKVAEKAIKTERS